ncbi:flagellar basal body rod protein FlgB [Desulfocurvibacter africanus]|uniref:flagellar basal body rod protein FlgB n=1 Tax=Desulfocurvibacter africanus TaxID=873 RepID=UPI002FD9D4F8
MERALLFDMRSEPTSAMGVHAQGSQKEDEYAMKTLFEPHMELTKKVMDLRLQRQNLVIANISNINTPNYKPRRLDFEEKLQKALDIDSRGKMARTDESHVPTAFNAKGFSGDWEKEFKPRAEHGQDSVDLDKEMAILSKNNMLYDALSQLTREGYKGINKVINESKS